MIMRFENVRRWSKIRGVNDNTPDENYQRFLQEAVEIHAAMVEKDHNELIDAIGDTIVTLINLADSFGEMAEDCLESAFNVIEYRKGLTKKGKGFVRYGKLSDVEKATCDRQQGNPGNEMFHPGAQLHFTPQNFKETK